MRLRILLVSCNAWLFAVVEALASLFRRQPPDVKAILRHIHHHQEIYHLLNDIEQAVSEIKRLLDDDRDN